LYHYSKGLSPQKLNDEQLKAVFREFDTDGSGGAVHVALTPPDPQLKGAWYPGGFNPCVYQVKTRFQNVSFRMQLAPLRGGELSREELGNAISMLGVKLSAAEIKELFVEMDSDMTGFVSQREFISWWKDSIGNASVEIIHTMEEFDQVLEDAEGTDTMTVLMVGVTYCKPCKAFTRKYADFAERFNGARFIKVFGNENKAGLDKLNAVDPQLESRSCYFDFL
jgi:Ca2+-binding EF-hand superfamily protein